VSAVRSQAMLLGLVAVGFFMQTLDATIVNTALPAMAHSLNESPLQMQSVVIAYSLTMAILIPASGWLADRFGIRRTFTIAMAVFTAGSALCAASRTLHELVAARVLQAAGGAMLLPVGRLALLVKIPREQFLHAMSFVTIPGLVGPLIGPTLGGWLAEYLSWHWIFLINLPVGIAGTVATWLFMPKHRGSPPRFDLSGYVMIAAAMVCLSLSLEGLAELQLPHALVLVLLCFGLAALAGYWLHAAQAENPLFGPDLFNVPTFSVGLLGNLFARIGAGSVPFLMPLLLQVGIGYSPSQAGMMLLPTAAAAMLVKRGIGPLIARRGYRAVLMSNTMLVGVAIASFALMAPHEPLWLRLLQLAAFGAVNSLQFTAMNTLTLKDLDLSGTTAGNSLLSMVQMLSMSFGVAVAAAILTTFTNMSQQRGAGVLWAFHATFLCVGAITTAAAWIFSQLSPQLRAQGERVQAVDVG
jgi:EmrB/QacA subfamily drug resistance transporter